jgi:oxygen-independent coproporphyrinogen-3 oxidase
VFISVPFGREPDWRTGAEPVGYEPAAAERFIDALSREITRRAPEFAGIAFDTVYFGGCGPSCLTLDQLYRLLQVLYDTVPIVPREQTMLVLPGTVDEPRAKVLRESGFDRVELRLGRHESGEADFRVLRQAEFETVGVEMAYVGESDRWEAVLSSLLRLEPDHVAFQLPDPLAPGMSQVLRRTRERLSAPYHCYGLHHFCRPGHECAYLVEAWERRPLLGFGPGALSRLPAGTSANDRRFSEYTAAVRKGRSPARRTESGAERLRADFTRLAGVPEAGAPAETVRQLVDRGMVERRDGRLFLTDEGKLALDDVCRALAQSD